MFPINPPFQTRIVGHIMVLKWLQCLSAGEVHFIVLQCTKLRSSLGCGRDTGIAWCRAQIRYWKARHIERQRGINCIQVHVPPIVRQIFFTPLPRSLFIDRSWRHTSKMDHWVDHTLARAITRHSYNISRGCLEKSFRFRRSYCIWNSIISCWRYVHWAVK